MRYENTGATESSEDYLEAILVIRAERGFCRNVDIAERLGVSRPSVTKALAGLSSRSLVEVVGRDVRLAPEGRRPSPGATFEKHEFFRRLLCDAGVDAEDGIRGGVPPGALRLRPLLPPPGGPPRGPAGAGRGRVTARAPASPGEAH